MKHLVKTILSQATINKIRQMRAYGTLARIRRDNFDSSGLRPSSEIDVAAIFSDPVTARNWQEDNALITGLFPSADLLNGVNPGDRRALYYLIMALRPQRVLEVGTHIGASTLYIAKALSRIGPDNQVTTVDICDVNNPEKGPWKRVGLPQPPSGYVNQIGCANRVQFIADSSLSYLQGNHDKFDLIFLDGDHNAPTVYKEIVTSLRRLSPNGIIVLHDYFPAGRPLYPDRNVIYGPYLAGARIAREAKDIAFLPLGQLPWATKQGTNATSLCLVVKK